MTLLQRPAAPSADATPATYAEDPDIVPAVSNHDGARSRSAPGRPSPSTAVARGALVLLSTQPATWTASLLSAALIPRFIGDREMGEYSVAVTISGLAGAVLALGVPGYLVRRTATRPHEARAEAAGAVVLMFAASLLAALALSIVLPLAGLDFSRPNLLRVAFCGMVVSNVQAVLNAVLIGRGNNAVYAWLNAGSVVIGVAAGLAVLAMGGSVTMFAATMVVNLLLTTIVAWWATGCRLQPASFSPGMWRRLVRGGLPFLGMGFAMRIRAEVDRILLIFLAGASAVGWYATAHRIIAIPLFIPTLITTPLLPALSRHPDDRAVFRETLNRSILAVLLLTVPVSATLAVVAPAVPDVLHWSRDYQSAVPLMIILALVQPLVALDMVLGTALIALKREHPWLRIIALGAMFNTVLNIALISLLDRSTGNGAIGAALTTLATELVLLACALRLLSGMIDRRLLGAIARIVVAAGCLALVGTVLRPVSPALSGIAGGLVFVAVAVALRLVGVAELAAFRDTIRELFASRLARAR